MRSRIPKPVADSAIEQMLLRQMQDSPECMLVAAIITLAIADIRLPQHRKNAMRFLFGHGKPMFELAGLEPGFIGILTREYDAALCKNQPTRTK